MREWWRPWPTAKRHLRRPHGTALRGERRMGCPDLACDPSNIYVGASAAMLRAAAQRRQGPSGIIGLTILDSSRCHRMAVGIRRMRGRLSAAKPCACSAAKYVRLRRRGCDAFVVFAHPAWVWRVSPDANRWLGSDLRSGQRREHRPNMPAPALRRFVASGRLVRRIRWAFGHPFGHPFGHSFGHPFGHSWGSPASRLDR